VQLTGLLNGTIRLMQSVIQTIEPHETGVVTWIDVVKSEIAREETLNETGTRC
jgi:hypothetical protein